jgi:hypothetical protein
LHHIAARKLVRGGRETLAGRGSARQYDATVR